MYLSCEIKYVKTIVDEIKAVFSDFEKYFELQKFQEFKSIVKKKLDISQDTLGASTSFTSGMLRIYGQAETYDSFAERLDKVTAEDIKVVYEDLHHNLSNIRVVMMSNDEEIKKVTV